MEFSNPYLYPNSSLETVDLFGKTTEELDADTDFINAVKVITRRETTPAVSYFARIFGYQSFIKSAQAIAYIGFAGSVAASEFDAPIAICQGAILSDDGEYDCSIGRMINSGQNAETNNSGGWANLDTSECSGGTNANEVNGLVCNTGGLTGTVEYGQSMGTSGGEIQSAFNSLRSCWENSHNGDPWSLVLPVIYCPGNNVSPCSELRGAVKLNVIWITGNGTDSDYSEVPTFHAGWDGTSIADGEARWTDFVDEFNLQNVGGTDENPIPAPYQKKAIYFLPSCEAHPPEGGTGGTNFGILAKIPVLVH